jgi:hypothetical protein
VGEQVSMGLSPNLADGCRFEPQGTPDTLTVEVSGPDNLPVPAEATLGNPPTATASLKFSPDKPGRYHIFAAFDPVGGIQQFDMYAARDRSPEAPVHTLPRTCTALERTRRGGWLCDSDFVRDGAVVQRFSGARVAVAGDVVWVVNGSQVQRYVDTGAAALVSTASMTGGASTTEFLLASETELLAIRSPDVHRIVFDGTATLAFKGSASLLFSSGTIGSTGLRGILVRSGEQLAVISTAPPSGGVQPANSFTSQVCSYRIEPDRLLRTADPCQTFTGDVVGYEPGALWVGTPLSFGDELADLRRLEWTVTGLAEEASLPLGPAFEVPRNSLTTRNSAVPVVISSASGLSSRPRPTVPVYTPERRTILLEFLDSEMPKPTASSALLWGGTPLSSSTSRIRVRPVTP